VRKWAWLALFLVVLLVVVSGWPRYVDKPAKDGPGPLAIHLDARLVAPETHNPLDWWRTHHMDVVNAGDFDRQDCLRCHDPVTSCNNCHTYVGVAEIQPYDAR
jgi:hypothetical protein